MSIPDFKNMTGDEVRAAAARMTREEIVEWFETTDDASVVLRHLPAVDPPPTFTFVTDEEAAAIDGHGTPMKSISVRLPEDMIAELRQRAGRDRDGASGLIRLAVYRFLHPGEAA